MLAYFTTLALFFAAWQLKLFSPARVYDLFGELLAGLNIFSLLFCLFLYFKACPAPHAHLATLHCLARQPFLCFLVILCFLVTCWC